MEGAEALHPHRTAAAGMIEKRTSWAGDNQWQHVAAAERAARTPALHAMPLVVALTAVGGALNLDSGEDEGIAQAPARLCGVRPCTSPVHPTPEATANRHELAVRCPQEPYRQILSGAQMTKLSAFGIFT